jgi:mutator protein MutT
MDQNEAGNPAGSISGSPTRPIEVAAGLVFRDGRLLITQRYSHAHQGGLWEFPGGKRHAGESFEECLARELREELGIETAVGELVETLVHHYPGRSVELRFFRCRWVRHEPQALGCPDFRWVTPPELGDYAFPAADARLLEQLRAHSEWW